MMETVMICANVKESNEQTMACFLDGLNHPIKRIADFQPYNNLLELVHQATKAERQVQEDIKYSKFSTFTSRNFTSNPRETSSVVPYPWAYTSKWCPFKLQGTNDYIKSTPTSSYKLRTTPRCSVGLIMS